MVNPLAEPLLVTADQSSVAAASVASTVGSLNRNEGGYGAVEAQSSPNDDSNTITGDGDEPWQFMVAAAVVWLGFGTTIAVFCSQLSVVYQVCVRVSEEGAHAGVFMYLLTCILSLTRTLNDQHENIETTHTLICS
jgi:hypothetical protein